MSATKSEAARHGKSAALKVFWVNQYAVTPDQAGGTRHFDMASELIRKRHSVTVVASDLSLSTRAYSRRSTAWDPRAVPELVRTVPFVWLPAGSYSRNDWRRVASMVIFGTWALLYLLRIRRLGCRTVFIGSSPHLFAAFGTWCAAKIRRVPFVLEVRDLWPESYTEVVGNSTGLFVTVLRKMADFLYKKADAILVLAEPNATRIAERGADPTIIHYVPNGVDLGCFADSAEPRPGQLVRFLYAGAHGPANGLDVVVSACAELERAGRHDIEVELVGDGPAKAGLVEQARSLQLTNLVFRDPVPKQDIPALLASADVGLMVLAPVELFTYGVSPNKLFDYLAANLPVLTNVPGLVSEIVETAGAGLSCEPGDPSALARAMAMLADDRGKLEQYRVGRVYVAEHFDRRVLADRLEEILTQVSGTAE